MQREREFLDASVVAEKGVGPSTPQYVREATRVAALRMTGAIH